MSRTIFISSLSKKVPLIKALRKSLPKTRIVGGDVNGKCIGAKFVDYFWQMPPLETLSGNEFLEFCKEKEISAVIPTRDGELLWFANEMDRLEDEGIAVMVSAPAVIQNCLDKLKFAELLDKWGFPVIEASTNIDEIKAKKYVVKERFGSGAKSVGMNLSKEKALEFAKKLETPLFQPYVEGPEVSCDLYVDRKGVVKGVVVRKRLLVVDGESQISRTFRDEKLEILCAELAAQLGLYGHVMFQCIKRKDGYVFLECNPRFGGASTLSIDVGLESFRWFAWEAEEKDIPLFRRADREKTLIRHLEDMIIP